MTQTHPALAAVAASSKVWRPEDGHDVDLIVTAVRGAASQSEILDAIEITINSSSNELRELSLKIHG